MDDINIVAPKDGGAPAKKSILIESFKKKNKEIMMLENAGLTAQVCTQTGKLLSKKLMSIFGGKSTTQNGNDSNKK